MLEVESTHGLFYVLNFLLCTLDFEDLKKNVKYLSDKLIPVDSMLR